MQYQAGPQLDYITVKRSVVVASLNQNICPVSAQLNVNLPLVEKLEEAGML